MSRNPYTNETPLAELPLFATAGDGFSRTSRVSRDFSGSHYDPERDGPRLRKQIAAVLSAIKGRGWLTLAEIASAAGCGEASASAQLRNLRKSQFGAHTIETRRRPGGLFIYRHARAEQAPESEG